MNKTQLLKSLKGRGFPKEVIRAFSKVPRENFVLQSLKHRAYEDIPLPIGYGQTISQPYTIGKMLELLSLKKGQRVLEIGSGCGYVLALIKEIVGKKGEVFGVEIVRELAEKSKDNLEDYDIKVYNKNGADGLNEYDVALGEVRKKSHPSELRGESARETGGALAYDRILISAGCEDVSEKILSQLKDGGILVAPVGSRYGQTLTVYQRKKDKAKIIEEVPGFIFVRFVQES